MKFSKRSLIITSLLILTPMIFGGIMWGELPEQIATHWNMAGETDDWSSRAFAVFGLPMLLLLIHWICIIVTAADHKNKDQNKKALNIVLWIMPVLSWFTNGMMYATAFGLKLNINSIIHGLLGIVFIIVGNYMPKIKQNHTIGIKIPHTLNSEENWNYTHRIAGRIWVASGIILLLCVFIPHPVSVAVMITIIIAAVIAPILCSYLYHKKEKEGNVVMKNKKNSKYFIIGLISVAVVVAAAIVIAIVFFGKGNTASPESEETEPIAVESGEIEITYGDESFTITTMHCEPKVVKYSEIGSTTYREFFLTGELIDGFSSEKLDTGSFKNEELGKYSRYAYSGENGFVVVELIDGEDIIEYIVVNGNSFEATNAIFNEITDHVAG